ncbi:Lipin-3 [Sparganum proliferum]
MGAINPADKSVEVYINGELVTSLHMRLGSAGYAYFVDDAEAVTVDSDSESVSVPVDNSEVHTPLFRMRSAEDLTDSANLTMGNRRRRRKARKDAPVSENHPEHFTFESTSFTPNELQPPSPPSYLSDNECERLQSSTFNTILESSQQEPRTNDPSPVPTTSFDSPTQLASSKDLSSSPVRPSTKEAHVAGSPGVYLEDLVTTKVDESIKQAYLYMTTSKNSPNDQYSSQELNAVDAGYRSDTEQSAQQSVSSLNLVRELKISLCGGLSADSQVNEESFYASLVTFEDFSKDPAGIVSNPNLVLFLNGKYYNWGMGAPLLLSYICFQTELPYSSILRLEQDFMPKKRPRRKAWFSWGTTEPETTKPELGKTEDPVSNIHVNEVTHELPKTVPVPEALNGNNKNEEKKDRPHRRLRLTSEEVLNLGLKPGVNSAEFRIVTKFQGTYSCSANIYLWRSDDQVVVSDVDGTITRSDLLGHVLPMLGHDWTHNGVAELYSRIASNGYKFVYLSARAIGQAGVTRSYLQHVFQHGKYRLPDGPVLLSPSSLMDALHREVIEGKPEIFKIECLAELREIFGPDASPFFAAFGNRQNDVLAYTEAGFEPCRIFTVNPNGMLRNECLPDHSSSFDELISLTDHIFPCLSSYNYSTYEELGSYQQTDSEDESPKHANAPIDMSVYSSFAFWRNNSTYASNTSNPPNIH